MTVLVLAAESDAPTDRVVAALAARDVPVFRADLRWFPQRLTLGAECAAGRWQGFLSTRQRLVRLDDVRAVWYRDPGPFELPAPMTETERAFAYAEARLGLGGVLSSLDALWVNEPNRACEAMYKPRQLAVAARCGLAVPRTAITNDAVVAQHFATGSRHGLVHKSLGSNVVTRNGTREVAFTRRTNGGVEDLVGIEHTAHQLQDWVDKDHEVRVVAVGDRLFPIAIEASSEQARVDWRSDYAALGYRQVELPPEVATGIRRYLRYFRLTYAAIDLVVDPRGGHHFLESNGAGQYGWLESATGAPITSAIADLLAGGRE